MAKGPLGNSPRDLHDEFVGEDVLYKGGEPPKKTRGPKRVTSNTFHAKVEGGTAHSRADRSGHFRSGGFVRGRHSDAESKKEEASESAADEKAEGYKSGGRLTAKARQSMPSSSFALPGKGKGPKGAGAGSYPIPDESYARNALARVSQHGSPSEKATVKAKVHSKYPGIGQK